ncbi:allophanate hydrolase subunit 1 [Marihabitans asiaticum]|uniref:KipI family sensor histidine kinase inhibitor n=1 Tax=Marihabitans asiaticum TaxID=415218 RepID=A0A560WH19_9MICO|nr:allophanate hydrolase subunit 1 [Marihabitans asiaticum]TWD16794.1 KipI family sensor histidine kinase inhibitor [Marihabitans asiaticum]
MGDAAILLETTDSDAVLALTARLEELRAAGEGPWRRVADVVPAARTVLLVADREIDLGELARQATAAAARETELPRAGGPASRAEEIEIPVVYDGADLDDVAAHTGLSIPEVIAAHTGTPWRVAFGGFAPGFGYLIGGDPRLQVPRRESPRTAVPAGSVALAGEYSAVYPRSSPGGWQLIGTTSTPMWDLDRDPPALLRPGSTVRFVQVAP